MSLAGLTFGVGKQSFSVPPMMHVFYPKDSIKIDPNVENKLQVIKVSSFYNTDDIYVVAQVISGVVKDNMSFSINGKKILVPEIESKLKGVAKQGMNVGFSLQGIAVEEIAKGAVLDMKPEQYQ
ncbi:MAG: hypothetical protein PHD95_03610 [Candidatus ainarchaeum sp.]|nr:hypothetical protein [Candidatus ainarchaeum sp.]